MYKIKRNKINDEITLTAREKEELRDYLYNTLITLSEYHSELYPKENDCLEELIDVYCYWGSRHNDKYIPEKEYNNRLSTYLTQKFDEWCREPIVIPVSDFKADEDGKPFAIYTSYAEDTDITFILKDIYDSDEEVESTECIGWYYGTEDDELTTMCSGRLKAVFK